MRTSDSKRAFDTEGPLRVVGHIWQLDADGNCTRHLVRRHQESGRAVFSKLHHVEVRDFCLACLSNNVETKFLSMGSIPPHKTYHCLDCGVNWWIRQE